MLLERVLNWQFFPVLTKFWVSVDFLWATKTKCQKIKKKQSKQQLIDKLLNLFFCCFSWRVPRNSYRVAPEIHLAARARLFKQCRSFSQTSSLNLSGKIYQWLWGLVKRYFLFETSSLNLSGNILEVLRFWERGNFPRQVQQNLWLFFYFIFWRVCVILWAACKF